MAVKRPGRDIDDAHAERFHGRKLAEALGELPKAPPKKPVARRPGIVLDSPGDQQEESVAEPEAPPPGAEGSPSEAQTRSRQPARAPRRREEERRRSEARDEEDDPREAGEPATSETEAPAPTTTAAHLAFADDHRRSLHRKLGFDQSPTLAEAAEALLAEEDEAGMSAAELLPSAAARAHPDLPEVELRPPEFLTPLQAMKDIYMRVKGRASRKTAELLEGVDLEDLLDAVRSVHGDEGLATHPEARLRGPIYRELKEDPGPLLLGLGDPRLTEVWRLFLEGWDLWVPDGRDDGIELFWEGEAEDEAGEPLEILQTLAFVEGELVLSTRLGALEDELVFDGERFFRLETKKPLPRESR